MMWAKFWAWILYPIYRKVYFTKNWWVLFPRWEMEKIEESWLGYITIARLTGYKMEFYNHWDSLTTIASAGRQDEYRIWFKFIPHLRIFKEIGYCHFFGHKDRFDSTNNIKSKLRKDCIKTFEHVGKWL